ncbi:hypothetical protein ACG2F4_09425 [Halalkalibaculum sp. DA3122]
MGDHNLYYFSLPDYHTQSVKACEICLSAALKGKSPAQRANVRLRGHLPFALLKNKFLGEVNPG